MNFPISYYTVPSNTSDNMIKIIRLIEPQILDLIRSALQCLSLMRSHEIGKKLASRRRTPGVLITYIFHNYTCPFMCTNHIDIMHTPRLFTSWEHLYSGDALFHEA